MRLVSAAAFALLVTLSFAASCKWPGADEHSISDNLPDNLEISGVAWSPVLQFVAAVGDEDALVVIETNGTLISVLRNSTRGFGLESVTFGPHSSQSLRRVYSGIEYPSAVVELDLSTGDALRLWNVTGFPVSSKYGMEALAFVPINSTTGWFYTGSQLTGKIYVAGPFSVTQEEELIDAQSAGNVFASGTFPIVATFDPGLSLDDLAALSYDSVHGQLWALFDRYNVAATLRNTTAITIDPSSTTNWVIDCEYKDVPGKGQEGICVAGSHGQYILIGQDRLERDMQLVRWDYDDQGVKM